MSIHLALKASVANLSIFTKMINPDSIQNIFTFSLNERRAQFNIVYDPGSDFPSLYHGQVQIKVYPEIVYFRWTIMESLTIGQGSFLVDQIPSGDDVFGHAQSKVVESIQNYCVQGEYIYSVQNWSWYLTNLDVEPVKKIAKVLESIRKRPRMFVQQPFEVEAFLDGIRMAYRILGFLQDEEVVKQSCTELKIGTSKKRLQQPGQYTWELVDKILLSEIAGWKRTYDISS